MRTIALVIAAALAPLACPAQEPPAAPPAPGPAWPDDPELQAALQELAAVLAANPGDARRDSLRAILERRKAIATGIERFRDRVLAHLIDARVVAVDITRFAHDTTPRLLGDVVRIGPQGDRATLAEALDLLAPGTLVLLGAGEHRLSLPRGHVLADVAFVGEGATTILTGQVEQAARVRFENLAIDCRDEPFLDLREGGAVHLRRCRLSGYNSGAGGSNAVFGAGVALLVEDCEFEGRSGRAAGGSNGDAFDLRGEFVLAMRRTQFVDNDEIVRALGLVVVDQCTAGGARGHGVMAYPSGHVFARGSDVTFHQTPVELPCLSDDVDFVRAALGAGKGASPAVLEAVAANDAAHNLAYWIALRRHADPATAALAAQGLARLLAGSPPEVPPFTEELARVPESMREAFAGELVATWLERWRTAGAGRDLVWDDTAQRYRQPAAK